MTDTNATLLRRAIEHINSGNMDELRKFFTPDFVRYDMGARQLVGEVKGPDSVIEFISELRAASPDFRMDIDDIIDGGDKVVVRYTARGTSENEFRGLPPTGKPLEWVGINIYRIEGGLVAESWQLADTLGILKQYGLV